LNRRNTITDDLLTEVASVLSKLSCDYAEARISAGTTTTIILSGESVDTMSSGESISGSVRVLNSGSWGFVAFNDLRDFERFAKRGIEISSRVAREERSGITSSPSIRFRYKTPVNKDFSQVSLEEKFNLAERYNRILRSSKFIQTTRTTYRDLESQYLYMNSEGSQAIYDKSFCGISFNSVAKDGNVIEPFGDSIAGYGGFDIVENREDMAERVSKVAIDLLSAEPVDGGKYNIVIDQKLAGVFIHEAFGHLSEADFVYENDRMREIMTLGRRFGPEELNVIDDGSIPELPGFIPFDDEGIVPERTSLIENGLLTARLHSRETAFKMKEKTTGNARAISTLSEPIVRMTNTYIDNGTGSREEIFDVAGDGIYAVDVIGGQTNLEMFTFSAGYGYKIENGRITSMLRDIVLSGNVFQTLNNIKMIGDDKRMYGGLGGCGKGGQGPLPVSFGGPHILIGDVLIGGKQR
jgi:TldD protein